MLEMLLDKKLLFVLMGMLTGLGVADKCIVSMTMKRMIAVSYTHLDVYKRQGLVFMVVLTLYYGLTSGGVDNMAHIGGCLLYTSQSGEPERFFLRTAKKQNVRIIGIFSPVHRSKKTGYALKLGKELARTYNVLYLNLEVYGGIGGHFPDAGQTVADALYYSRQEKLSLIHISGIYERLCAQ